MGFLCQPVETGGILGGIYPNGFEFRGHKLLTDAKVKQAKPKQGSYKLADGRGLYVEVMPNGSKYWRYKYRVLVNGKRKEKRLALGVYPEVSLKRARDLHAPAHALVSSGGDPSGVRQDAKEEARNSGRTFGELGQDWFDTKSATWSKAHRQRQTRLFGQDLARLHDLPLDAIKAPDVIKVLRIMEERGAIESAHRAKQVASQIFRHAITMGVCDQDPAVHIGDALKEPVRGHHAAIIEPDQLGQYLRAVDDYWGAPVVRIALMLVPMFLLRPGNIAHLEWSEVDLNKGECLIPAHKMKKGEQDHYVPLSRQAVELFEEVRYLTGNYRYVFTSPRTTLRPIVACTLTAAMRRMGITKEQATAHGFRATARTIMDERLGIRADIIDHQLSHKVRDVNGRAYNRTKFLQQRKEMMQAWADYLDQLRAKV